MTKDSVSSATQHPANSPGNTAGERWSVWTHSSLPDNPNDCWSVIGPDVRDNKKMRGYSREHALLFAASPGMRKALEYIADTENTGRWSHIPIDTEAANGWAMCVQEMQRAAAEALSELE